MNHCETLIIPPQRRMYFIEDKKFYISFPTIQMDLHFKDIYSITYNLAKVFITDKRSILSNYEFFHEGEALSDIKIKFLIDNESYTPIFTNINDHYSLCLKYHKYPILANPSQEDFDYIKNKALNDFWKSENNFDISCLIAYLFDHNLWLKSKCFFEKYFEFLSHLEHETKNDKFWILDKMYLPKFTDKDFELFSLPKDIRYSVSLASNLG